MKRLFILFTMLLLAVVACRKDSEVPMNVATITDEVQAFETYATIKGTINCAIPTKRLEMYLYTNPDIASKFRILHYDIVADSRYYHVITIYAINA